MGKRITKRCNEASASWVKLCSASVLLCSYSGHMRYGRHFSPECASYICSRVTKHQCGPLVRLKLHAMDNLR